MADSSFDIVSKVDRQEADNALQQTAKELATRFDFKGTDTVIEWKGELIVEITSTTEDRAKAALEVFKEKLINIIDCFQRKYVPNQRVNPSHCLFFFRCRISLGWERHEVYIRRKLFWRNEFFWFKSRV